jgi:hypothetical protein
MLDLDTKNTYRGSWEQVIDTLGVPAVIHATGGGSKSCVVGFKTTRDEEIVNAWGVGTKVVTIKVTDAPEVKKMDRVDIGNERYTFDAVFPVHLNADLIGWRCVVKGK